MDLEQLSQGPLSSLSKSDRHLFLQYGFGVSQKPAFGCVHHAFEHHATLSPSAAAVEHLGSSISYAELDHQANGLAHRLRTLGVWPGVRVCLLIQRSIPMIIAIMAVLKAGGSYIPLDGDIVTQSTLEFVIQDSSSPIVLAMEQFIPRVQHLSGLQYISLERAILEHYHLGHRGKPSDMSSPNDSVYAIYTSGTTGRPKGVDVTNRNVTNLLCLDPGRIGMVPGLRVSQLLNVAFDMCAWEVLGALCNGCTLCIRGNSSKEWVQLMKTVDVLIATPSILRRHNPADYPNISYVATAGEACPQALADSWSRHAQYFNCCGPTETTIVNTVQPHKTGAKLSIGRPTPNNNVYILDDNANPLPIGETGVMWAGGACITKGYLNLPEKTAEKYKYDPFVADGSFMFNTGDLGRWRLDGQLEHLGRLDDQVKVKGFRVELDGVSAAMETCPGVEVAVALLIEDELWGFVTPEHIDVDDVKSATAKIQPKYAVPTRYCKLASFEQTNNGKTDRAVLRKFALDMLSQEESIPPQTLTEKHSSHLTSIPDRHSINSLDPKLWPSIMENLPAPPPIHASASKATPHSPPSSSSVLIPTIPEAISDMKGDIASAAEKGEALEWEGYENDVLPAKTHGRFLRNLRHQIFTLYRRLFGIVLIINLSIFIATLVRGGINAQQIGLIVVANLFCSILMRQDYIINAFFTAFCSVPTSWPLCIRRVCARVYHIGGLHSGCGISGLIWLILFAAEATVERFHYHKISVATLTFTYAILLLLILIVLFAYPSFRVIKHDRFERTHRFLGWTATALVWGQVIFLTNDYRKVGQTLGQTLVHSPAFWLVVIMTGSIILPWIRLRKVHVRAEVLSSHAVRLYFDYGKFRSFLHLHPDKNGEFLLFSPVTPIPGSFTRISDNPLMEWHGFATVPEPEKKGYSLVVSKAGDWTTRQIENPPTRLWVRGVPTCGVLRIVPLFRRLVFVATGSGIGPCAPCILEQRVPIRLLWTSPNVRKTFGNKFVDSILQASPNAVIYDTRVHGKPDMVKLTYRMVKEFDAEAVCIISNQKLTRKVVYGMISRGIPAFGAIWDS